MVMEKYTSLDLLLETGLRHLYTAEHETYKNLKVQADTALSSGLKDIFIHHRGETEFQINRLEKIFGMLGIDIKATKLQGIQGIAAKGKELLKTMADLNFTDRSKGMEGIVNEGKELLRHFANTDANDMALVSAGLKVEHFEIACYKALADISELAGRDDIVPLLKDSLHEEIKMQEKMSEFTKRELKKAA